MYKFPRVHTMQARVTLWRTLTCFGGRRTLLLAGRSLVHCMRSYVWVKRCLVCKMWQYTHTHTNASIDFYGPLCPSRSPRVFSSVMYVFTRFRIGQAKPMYRFYVTLSPFSFFLSHSECEPSLYVFPKLCEKKNCKNTYVIWMFIMRKVILFVFCDDRRMIHKFLVEVCSRE